MYDLVGGIAISYLIVAQLGFVSYKLVPVPQKCSTAGSS